MKKTYTKNIAAILLLLVNVPLLQAQITITHNHLPKSGYTYEIYNDTLSSVNLGTPGPLTQAWDFSNLISHYPSVPTYGETSTTAFAGDFPLSNQYTYGPSYMYSGLYGIAPVDENGANNGYMFWQNDNTGFWSVGFRAESGPFANINYHIAPKELLIPVSFTYNSTVSNSGRYELDFAINPADIDTFYVSRVTKTFTGDAWGSLTTPFASYSDVLRIHEYRVRTDSAIMKMNGFVVFTDEIYRDTSNNYMYISDNLSYPAAIVYADVNNAIKSVEFYKSSFQTSVEKLFAQENLKLYPNPFSDYCTIEIPETFSLGVGNKLEIYGLTGNLVSIQNINSRTFRLDRGEMKEGIYFYRLYNSMGEIFNGKFCVN
jgi:hypothetical protein